MIRTSVFDVVVMGPGPMPVTVVSLAADGGASVRQPYARIGSTLGSAKSLGTAAEAAMKSE